MLQLLLLRHAKSSWDEPGLEDVQRPLNERGRKDAKSMGETMAELGLAPNLVLCSPAERTRQTWDLLRASLAKSPPAIFEAALYDFGMGDGLQETIAEQGGVATSMLVIGHNPSIENLAIRLCDRDSGKLRERMEKKYPTGALAVFALPITNWGQLSPGLGRLTHFIRPKDLQES